MLARMQQPFCRFGEPVDRGWTDPRDVNLDAEPDDESLRGHTSPLGAIHNLGVREVVRASYKSAEGQTGSTND